MMRFPIRRLAVFALLAVLVFALSGCWNPFAPNKGKTKPIEPADYRDRETPEDVIHNLRTAYIWKNAAQYLDCLSEDFIFYPTDEDVQDPNANIPPEWYKPQESEMHTNMFDSGSDVESISLVLTEMTSEYIEGIPGDLSDDIYIYREGVDLRVNLVTGTTLLATAPSEYWFRVDQDQQGEGGEIWWEIYLWYDNPIDTRPRSQRDPDVDYVSLAQLKNYFR
jgi:hypothetical protein